MGRASCIRKAQTRSGAACGRKVRERGYLNATTYQGPDPCRHFSSTDSETEESIPARSGPARSRTSTTGWCAWCLGHRGRREPELRDPPPHWRGRAGPSTELIECLPQMSASRGAHIREAG